MSLGIETGALGIEDMVRALREVALEEPASRTALSPVKTVNEKGEAVEAAQYGTTQTRSRGVWTYTISFVAAMAFCFGALVYGNKTYLPEMYALSLIHI